MFITFEGVEGSGKSTQVHHLRQTLEAHGHTVWATREPGGTLLAETIRQVVLTPDRVTAALTDSQIITAPAESLADTITPIAELLLMNAARAQLVQEIERRRAAGTIVLCDRFADATFAYQGGGRGIPRGTIAPIVALVVGTTWPDLTILLDLDPAIGLSRKQEMHTSTADWNRIDEEQLAFHERVRATYHELATAEPDRWFVIDATQTAETLAEQIAVVVTARLAMQQR